MSTEEMGRFEDQARAVVLRQAAEILRQLKHEELAGAVEDVADVAAMEVRQ